MRFRFGLFEFDAETGELRKSGRLIALEPQPARVLAALLARAGEVVTRDELRAAVWPEGTHVDFDRGLAYCLGRVRAALGDTAENPRFVQTLPRRGFRFIAPVTLPAALPPAVEPAPAVPAPPGNVERSGPGITATGRWLTAVAATALLSIAGTWTMMQARRPPGPVVVAVSLFDNETGLAEHDRLVQGLTDLVVTRLTQLAPERVTVVGNATVLRQPRNIRNLKAVEDAVRADFVLLGQLQKAGDDMRFITHVIRLRDGTHLKANRLPMPGGDLSGLEDAVVAEFERAVRERVLSAGPAGARPAA